MSKPSYKANVLKRVLDALKNCPVDDSADDAGNGTDTPEVTDKDKDPDPENKDAETLDSVKAQLTVKDQEIADLKAQLATAQAAVETANSEKAAIEASYKNTVKDLKEIKNMIDGSKDGAFPKNATDRPEPKTELEKRAQENLAWVRNRNK